MTDNIASARLNNALQSLIAESMLFGMHTFRDGKPEGSLFDDSNRSTLARFEHLREKTSAVVEEIQDKEVSVSSVLPLYEEIFRQLDNREPLQ